MKVELWLAECYGCEQDNKFAPLRRWVLDSGISWRDYVVKRVITNPDWQDEWRSSGVELPAVKMTNEKGEVTIVNYQEWLLSQIKENMAKPADEEPKKVVLKKRTASIKKKEVKTTKED